MASPRQDTGWAEYVAVDAVNAHAVPPGVGLPAAALTEPLSGAWKGVIHEEVTAWLTRRGGKAAQVQVIAATGRTQVTGP